MKTVNDDPRSPLPTMRRGVLFRPSSNESIFPAPAEFFENPFAAVRRMHEEMDRIFGQVYRGSEGSMNTWSAPRAGNGDAGSWSPAIETNRQGNDLVVWADLPGVKPADVRVEVDRHAIVIEGERRRQIAADEDAQYRGERQYGRFSRSIPLEEEVNAEQARASFHDGVLEIRIPVNNPQLTRRQIPVSVGSATPETPDTVKASRL